VSSRKLWHALHAVDKYLRGQAAWLVNYAKRYQAGLRVGTSITEGTAVVLPHVILLPVASPGMLPAARGEGSKGMVWRQAVEGWPDPRPKMRRALLSFDGGCLKFKA
jgi:hypothetical protein